MSTSIASSLLVVVGVETAWLALPLAFFLGAIVEMMYAFASSGLKRADVESLIGAIVVVNGVVGVVGAVRNWRQDVGACGRYIVLKAALVYYGECQQLQTSALLYSHMPSNMRRVAPTKVYHGGAVIMCSCPSVAQSPTPRKRS